MLYNILKKAKSKGFAIGQFNFSSLEQLRGIASCAREQNFPVILGTSEKEASFLGLEETVALVRILENKMKFRLFLHLDHGKDLNFIKRAIDLGYDSVHFDGSSLFLKDNIRLTKKIVGYGHKKKVLVEGELGYLGGESKYFKSAKAIIRPQDLTNPKEVGEFVKKTGVDSLAIAIGNIHGVYEKMPKFDFRRLKEIRENTDVFLVLHGGSGVPAGELKKAIRFGIQKININTELRIVWKRVLLDALKDSGEMKPYLILPQVERAIKKKVEKYIKLFRSC